MEGIYAHADLIKVYKAILDASQEIATYLRYHSGKQSTHWRRRARENQAFNLSGIASQLVAQSEIGKL